MLRRAWTPGTLDKDVAGCIAQHLDKCELSPFTSAGATFLPHHGEEFAWHHVQLGMESAKRALLGEMAAWPSAKRRRGEA